MRYKYFMTLLSITKWCYVIFQSQKDNQHDKLMAKLAARKRMKEELNKENAVAGELDRITKAQVGDQSLV